MEELVGLEGLNAKGHRHQPPVVVSFVAYGDAAACKS